MATPDFAALFAKTLTPSGMLPEPLTKPRRGKPGRSLMLHSKAAKAVALWRIELLPVQQCGRSLLALLVTLGRGKRCRSWEKDETIAEQLQRSGLGSYSVPSIRRWRRVFEYVGLVRCTYVAPGGELPHKLRPDEDGGGWTTPTGQQVCEVNMDALLGLAPVWVGRVRAGWLDAREAKAAASELREALEAEARAALLEDDGDELEGAPLEPDAPPAPPSTPAPADPGGVIIHGHGGVILHDHPFTDLGSPSENHPDPVREDAHAAPTALLTPADAGSSHERGAPRGLVSRPTTPTSGQRDERASAREVSRGDGPHSSASPATSHASAPPTESARRGREQTADHRTHGAGDAAGRPARAEEIADITRRNCPWLAEQLGLQITRPRGRPS
jgi:hypothetical protein